jgi:hypothetical protein
MNDPTPFPVIPLIGELDILDVFAFHDCPRLFTAQNATGQIYLAEWASEDEGADFWLLVPMSLSRYRELVSGEMDFRSAYVESETSFVYGANVHRSATATVQIGQISSAEVPDQLLPLAGERITEKESALIPLAARILGNNDTVPSVPALDLRLSQEGRILGVKALADFLKSLQGLSDAAYGIVGSARGRKGRPTLGIVGAYAGSLGLVISSVEATDPDGAKRTAATLEKVLRLIDAAVSIPEDLEHFSTFERPLKSVLRWLDAHDVDATLTPVLIPHMVARPTRITPPLTRAALERLAVIGMSYRPALVPPESELDPQTALPPPEILALPEPELPLPAEMLARIVDSSSRESIRGLFNAVDLGSLTFRFRADSGDVYTGHVRPSVLRALREITLARRYDIRVLPNERGPWELIDVAPVR